MSKNADGRRDRKEGQVICQCTDLSQGSSSDCTKDPNHEAGIGGRLGENRMRWLAEQAVECQRRRVGEGVGRRSS